MGEKWISLFFNRRWTQINADVRRDLALLIVKRAIAFLNLGEKGISLFFNRRWTQINADTGLDNSPAI